MRNRCVDFMFLAVLITGGSLYAYAESYHRDAFIHWSDVDHDGYDARQQALKMQSVGPVKCVKTSHGFVVVSGKWICPYTGKIFTNPHDVDLDHVVSLSWAWKHGADSWKPSIRTEFANDQENLLVVDATENRRKGDKGPDEWLPSRKGYRTEYHEKWTRIIKKYELEE